MITIALGKDKQGRAFLVSQGLDIEVDEIQPQLSKKGFIWQGSKLVRLYDIENVRDLMNLKTIRISPKVIEKYQNDVLYLTPIKVFPNTFEDVMLMPYQKEGVKACLEIGNFLFCDDMGLGKTAQALKVSEELGARTLIICPSTLIDEWETQIKKFTASRCIKIQGSWPIREKLWKSWAESDGLAIKYIIMSWDALRSKRDFEAAQSFCRDGMIVFDEITKGKNARSQRSKAAASLKARRILGITGSPIENDLKELWHLLHIVRPELYPNYNRFADQFMILEDKSFGGHTFKDIVGYKNLEALKTIIQPYYIRRLRTEVLNLPPSSTVIRKVALSQDQRDIESMLLKASQDAFKMNRMELVLKYFTYGIENFITPKILPSFEPDEDLQLEQQILTAIEEASPDPSPREKEALNILKEAEPNKIILFSGFKKALDRLVNFVDEPVSWLSSGVDVKAELAAWKKGDSRILFMTSAGAMGHNLQDVCSMMVVLSSLHNPRMMDQLLARISRMGQNKPVTYYLLNSDSAIEAKLRENTLVKNELSENVFRNTDLARMVML